MADASWVDPHEVLPEDWDEMSDAERDAWTRGFTAGGTRVLEKIVASMATLATEHAKVDPEEVLEFLNAVPKEALPDA